MRKKSVCIEYRCNNSRPNYIVHTPNNVTLLTRDWVNPQVQNPWTQRANCMTLSLSLSFHTSVKCCPYYLLVELAL